MEANTQADHQHDQIHERVQPTSSRPATLLLLAVGSMTLFALFYPALNWPDEVYKISEIEESANPYLATMRLLSGDSCTLTVEQTPDFEFGSNRFQYELVDGQLCYRILKTWHLLLVGSLAAAAFAWLRSNYQRSIFALSLLWPSISFYVSEVNNQAVFIVGSVAIVTKSLGSTRPWALFPWAFALLIVDRSAITLVIYLAIFSAATLRPRLAPYVAALVSLALVSRILVIDALASVLVGVDDLEALRSVTESLEDPLYVSVALFCVSFVYIGGTNSIYGLGFDYLAVAVGIGWLGWRYRNSELLRTHLSAFVATYLTVLSFVPTIQTFRYYVFVLPVVVHLLADSRRLGQYRGYCIAMTVLYVVQAQLIDSLW